MAIEERKESSNLKAMYGMYELLIRQQTVLSNALRGHLAEFGIVARQGRAGVTTLIALVEDDEHELVPRIARGALLAVVDQLRDVLDRIGAIERRIHAWHRSNEQSRRLETIPGIGPIGVLPAAVELGLMETSNYPFFGEVSGSPSPVPSLPAGGTAPNLVAKPRGQTLWANLVSSMPADETAFASQTPEPSCSASTSQPIPAPRATSP